MNVRQYIPHYRAIIKLGAPILLGQLGMIAVGFVDNIMVGNYATEALAASSFVINVFNIAMMFLLGLTMGLTPIIGAMHARGEHHDIGRTVRLGLKANTVASLLVTAVMGILYFFIPAMGQPAELLPYIRPYYLIFLAGLVPVVIYNVFAQWSYGISNTVMPTVIVLSCNLLNVAGNYALIYGHWGMPQQGLTGAGISTLVARMLCMITIVAIFLGSRKFAVYRRGFFNRPAAGDAPRNRTSMRHLMGTSLPVAMQMGIETASFSFAAVIAGTLPDGALNLGAFQILLIVGTLGFCVYYSMGAGVAVLVSNAAGRDDHAAMRTTGWAGYHVILALAACSSLLFATCGERLIGAFSKGDTALIALAVAQIGPLVLYQLADATQINFANALRGTSHVRSMMWISAVSYIVIGVPATWLMGVTWGMGLRGIYLSFSVSLAAASAGYLYYFLRHTRRR